MEFFEFLDYIRTLVEMTYTYLSALEQTDTAVQGHSLVVKAEAEVQALLSQQGL